MSLRTEKVASVIQRVLGHEMQLLELPFLTTISKVEVSPDLKHGRVWITVLPAGEDNEQKILEILANNIYDLQQSLNQELKIKIVPKIKFHIDHSEEFASHINKLLKDTYEEN
jgi:ribosome-binding factor A